MVEEYYMFEGKMLIICNICYKLIFISNYFIFGYNSVMWMKRVMLYMYLLI